MSADLAARNRLVTPVTAAAVLTIAEAEALTRFCDKTLLRLTNDGHKLGRFRVGRAVRYHRATLEAWLKAQADVQAVPPPAAG